MSKQSKKATIKKMTDVYNELWSESWSVFNTLTTFENMLPPFPSDKWSFRGKAEEHVIVFDASGVKKGEIPEKDLHYLLQMYELDYVAVITKNVVGQELLNHHTLDPLFLLTAAVAEQKAECRFEVMKKPHEIGKGGAGLMDVYYETGDYHLNDVDDEDNFVSGSDFAAFLKKQIAHHERDPEKRKAKEAVKNVKLNQLDLNTTTVYLKDLFLPSSGAELDAKMKHEIKLPTVPHGDYCMMQSFPADMLQVMGLGFLTYGGGSKFHEDARGQMDSGHICLKGYNHVVILRRLESDDVKGFQSMLTVAEKRDIQNSDEPKDYCWPSNNQFKKLQELRYIPIRLILQPNEHLHIPSSRYHCFRKATNGQLPATDCHYQLHSDLLDELKEKYKNETEIPSKEFLAFSYTWDFVYTGFTLNGIKRIAEVLHTKASVDQAQYYNQTPAASRTAILLTAHKHAAVIVASDDIMVLDLQRSKTVLQALSPTVQLLKKDMEEEFEIVRQHEKQQLEQERLKKSAVLPQKTPGRKKRGRPKKATVTAPKVDDKTYTIAEKADTAKFLYGSPFCSRCKGELFNLYYKCQGCDKQAENVVLCKECIYSEDITPCPDQTAKQHSPSENDHQCFDVKFRFYHFRQSLGDSSYFKTIQEALAKMRVGLLRTDPVRDDDEANKGIMRAKEQCDTFVQKLMRERRELTKSLEKRSKELALPVYESDAASHLITPTIPVCNDTIDVWRNLLLIREHEKQTTSPGTAASYIFPTSFYTMYDQFGSTEKNRSAYKAFTENWDLPNGQSKPPWNDIFELDKLLIPVGIMDVGIMDEENMDEENNENVGHWILICCHMSSRTISVYDTDSHSDEVNHHDAQKEAKKIRKYLWEEERERRTGVESWSKQNPWTIKVVEDTPQQSKGSMDCAVFVCLFMDFLLHDFTLQLTQEDIRDYGRKWLFMSICYNEILLDKN